MARDSNSCRGKILIICRTIVLCYAMARIYLLWLMFSVNSLYHKEYSEPLFIWICLQFYETAVILAHFLCKIIFNKNNVNITSKDDFARLDWSLSVGTSSWFRTNDGSSDKLFCEFATSLNCSYIGEVAERMAVVLN